MPGIYKTVISKYSRPIDKLADQRSVLANQLNDCIHAALSRGPVKKIARVHGGDIRAADFDKSLTFVNIHEDNQPPFLAVGPSEINIPPVAVKYGKKVEVSILAHPFNDNELEIVDQALPFFEHRFGDTTLFSHPTDHKIDWSEGMFLQDELQYLNVFQPPILEEIDNLVLSDGDLVCDPGCGTGLLLKSIKERFPQLNLIGSDLVRGTAEKAKQLNQETEIYVEDAQTLDYLETSSVALFLLSGLANYTVVTKEEAKQILFQVLAKGKDYSYLIINGKTLPHFNSDDLINFGFYPYVRTKWHDFRFNPFYLCLVPRKIINGYNATVMPIVTEIQMADDSEES